MIVWSVILENHVDDLAHGDLALDGIEEGDEPPVVADDHYSFEYVESGIPRRRAIPLVIVGHRSVAAGFRGKPSRVRPRARICDFSSTPSTIGWTGGLEFSPTILRGFGTHPGSRNSLKWRPRCGWGSCARQMRCTEETLIPIWAAIVAGIQCLASTGGSACVSATTTCSLIAGGRGNRDGQVLFAKQAGHAFVHETILATP
jgi:hypothetical protein